MQHLASPKRRNLRIHFHSLKGCGEPPPSSQFLLILFILSNIICNNCCKRISLINFSPPFLVVNFDPEPCLPENRPKTLKSGVLTSAFIPPKLMDLEEVPELEELPVTECWRICQCVCLVGKKSKLAPTPVLPRAFQPFQTAHICFWHVNARFSISKFKCFSWKIMSSCVILLLIIVFPIFKWPESAWGLRLLSLDELGSRQSVRGWGRSHAESSVTGLV